MNGAWTGRVVAVCLGVGLALVASPPVVAGAQEAVPVPPVVAHATLSRTAVWIGEPVTYTVLLRCAPGIDVLTEDLGRDRLTLEGGEVLRVDSFEARSGDQLTRRVEYTIATMSVDHPVMRLGALRVRYFARSGLGGAPPAPAGEITVPATAVAVRSSLATFDTVPAPRVPEALGPLPLRVQLAPIVGWSLVALAALPLLLWAVSLSGLTRQVLTRHGARRRRGKRPSFADLKRLEPSSDAERLAAIEQLEQAIRAYLQTAGDIPATALTPGEIEAALADRPLGGRRAEIRDVLTACERARYSPAAPAAEAWPRLLAAAEDALRR